VAVAGNYAYVSAGHAGLGVVDISTPADPRWTNRCDTASEATGVTVSGNYAYVAACDAGLQVFDISSPANPQLVGGCDTDGYAEGVAVSGNYAYVADGDAGLCVIDIANPTRAQGRGRCLTGGYAEAVALLGNYAYVANGDAGLSVIDVADPAKPQRVGGNSCFPASAVVVEAGMVYTVSEKTGLVICEPPSKPLRFLPPMRLDASGFRTLFEGDPGQVVRLQRSQDLKAWEDWMPVTATGTPQEVIDSDAVSRPRQFYRAVSP